MYRIKKICINCGQEFECTFDRAKYCSNACKSAYRRKSKGELRNCKYCGKEFFALYHEDNGFTEFCSKECSSKYMHENMKEKYLICKHCGKEFLFKGSTNAKYCKECRKEISRIQKINSDVKTGKTKLGFVGKGGNNKKGKESPFYKNGIGEYRDIKYNYMKENNIPEICEICGSTEFLVVHHIDHDRKNNNIENLQLVCRSCHIKLHCKRDKLGRFKNIK